TDGSTCTHVAGTFTFHPSHHHFHMDDFGAYLLRKDDPYTGPVVATASKISFCLTDVEPQRGFDGTRQVFADCGVQEGTQGISSGWADVYDDFYPEQYIELDADRTDGGVPGGQYYLVNVADPDNLLIEDDDSYADNAGIIAVDVPGLISQVPAATPTPTMAPPNVSPSPTATTRPTISRPPRPTISRGPRPTRVPRPPSQLTPPPTRAPIVHPTHGPVVRATPTP
ncbi:MAG: hypothetical protein HY270_23935, partial [Deltaproteobacteria bacterium]|nr:hypothetical protein [Deltaproteobacteria bacterium]